MSTFDLLTSDETAHAARQGWLLCRVFDETKNFLTVLPLAFSAQLRNAEVTRRYVQALALQGDKVAVKALVAITADALPIGAHKKKKKAAA